MHDELVLSLLRMNDVEALEPLVLGAVGGSFDVSKFGVEICYCYESRHIYD